MPKITLEEALDELERLKRYPTHQELCTTLSAELGWPVVYDSEYNNFYFLQPYLADEKQYISQYCSGRYSVKTYLTSKSLSLVARFYEGLEKGDSNA